MLKEVYNPKAVIPHAASLHQACAHCAIFPTAASRRSLGRVSVPVWPVALSGRLPVVALVRHHRTNKLIGRGPIPHRKSFPPPPMRRMVISGIRPSFPGLSQSAGQITHVLLTRSPLNHHPKVAIPFDLHVLSTPPAFVLSQDQTLQKNLTPYSKKPNETGFQTNIYKLTFGTLLSSQTTHAHPSHTQSVIQGLTALVISARIASEPTVAHPTTCVGAWFATPCWRPVPFGGPFRSSNK